MDTSFEEKLNDTVKLKGYVDEEIKKAIEALPQEKYRSDDIAELMTAFAKAQSNYPIIKYNRQTSMFQNEYTDLDLIMLHLRPILGLQGLSFYQMTKYNPDGVTLLDSFLFHASGQWIKSQTRVIPSSDDKLAKISCLNSEARVQAQRLLNVTVKDDLLDDDFEKANEEFEQQKREGTDLNFKYNPKLNSLRITKSELEDVQYELKELPDIASHLLERLRIESFADMPKDQYHKVIDYIRSVARERKTPKK
jgi:hypothetical protein